MKHTFLFIGITLLSIHLSLSQEVRWSFNVGETQADLSSAKTISKTLDGNYLLTAYSFINGSRLNWTNQAIFYNTISGDTTIYNIDLAQKTPLFMEALSLNEYILILTNGEIYKLNFDNEAYELQQRLQYNGNNLTVAFVDKFENTLIIAGNIENQTIHFEYDLEQETIVNSYVVSNPSIPVALAYLPSGDQIRGYNPEEAPSVISRTNSDNEIIWLQTFSENMFITDIAVFQEVIYISSTKREFFGMNTTAHSAIILAYNHEGEKLWETEIQPAAINLENRVEINKIDITDNGDIIGVGLAGDAGISIVPSFKALVCRLDSSGTLIGRITYRICRAANIAYDLLIDNNDIAIMGNCGISDTPGLIAFAFGLKVNDIDYNSSEINCGDDRCAPVEDYCTCEDCRVDEDGNRICAAGNMTAIRYDEDDDGYFFSDDLSGNIFFCSEFVNGYSNENTYLGFGVLDWDACDGTEYDTLKVELSIGTFLNIEDSGDNIFKIPISRLTFIELSPADLASGSITITGESIPDGLGNQCQETLTLNFADFPQITDPYCTLECFASGIDPNLLDNGLTVCEGESFTISTNGLEDLTLACNSDDGSPYVYAWRVLVDIYNTGEYNAVAPFQPLGTNPIINTTTFFIDEFGYTAPYFAPGFPISPIDSNTGEPRKIRIQGAALCLDADGSIEDGCVASNEGYESSQIEVLYLPANDEACSGNEVIECTPPAVGSFNCDE